MNYKLLAKLVMLVTLGIVLAGCTRAQDNGFLTACGSGVSSPIDLSGDCYEVVWPSTPLAVYSDTDVPALQRAIERWEHRRPFQRQDLFRWTTDPSEAQIVVDINVCCSDTALGDASFRMEPMRAHVSTYNTPFEWQLECVLFHELGHALGLAHDDYGPMQPYGCDIQCSPSDIGCEDDTPSITDLRVTDGDHRRLNDVY